MRASYVLIAMGAALCLAALLAALAWPQVALAGWLAAAVAATAVPTGALVLMMMMRLIPGAWGEVLRLACEAAVMMTPLAAAAFLPVFFGLAWLYPWVERPAPSAFAAAWLTIPGYVVRTLIWFAYLGGFGWAMIARQRSAVVAAVGLLLMPVLAHLVCVDWLLSRDPEFASSAFGLQILSIMTTIAFCAVFLLRHAVGARPVRTGVLGALLLTLVLIWAYLNFMAYLIVWSGNLPPGVGWYKMRGGVWAATLLLAAVLGGVPLLLLLFSWFRSSPRRLAWIVRAVLAGKLIELLWFAVPPQGLAAELVGAGAIVGIGCLYGGLLPLAFKWRLRRRSG
jgi:hypothetical protein